ncbi:MAG: hypothetical protein FWF59_03605 [Turicibacter sp.]|nr:hypothetical protein [Turicibacter sp.]
MNENKEAFPTYSHNDLQTKFFPAGLVFGIWILVIVGGIYLGKFLSTIF